MASDTSTLRTQRPDLQQYQTFAKTPDYIKHKAYEDQFAILVCLIKIWKPKGQQWFDIPKVSECLAIRECESIEISDSAKDLLGKAVVRFPRGTVVNLSSLKDKEVPTGNPDDSTESTDALKDATNDGDVMTPQASQFNEDGVSTVSAAINYDDKGLIDFNRHKEDAALLSPNDVATGNRIEIRLGYAYSETEFKKMNSGEGENLDVAFTGFITSISVDTPLELECVNMAHVLTTISAPNITAKDAVTVKDFLDDDSEHHLLKDTGIQLAESSKGCDISVSGGAITDNLTVADVLAEWSNSGVLCIMETDNSGVAKLRVGLTYYAGQGGEDLPNNDKKYITYNGGNNSVMIIQFDWDVAQDKLGLKQTDKKYFAVEAHGFANKEGDRFKLTIRKNPDNDDEGWAVDEDGEWQTVNEKKVRPPKKNKRKGGTKTAVVENKMKNKVDLKKYSVITYFSIKKPITKDELIAEAKQFWAKHTPNGIEGSIEIFGDLFIKPTDIVGLVDLRHPAKNGYYYVEAVNTSFGMGGYRRELRMPFKIASFAKPIMII